MLAALFLLATLSPPPRLAPLRTDAAPAVDGRLDEPAWRQAPGGDAFTQKLPDEGLPSSEHTTVQVLYDDTALYFGVTCEQRGYPVIGRLTRRDREVEADWIAIDLDTRHDGRSAFHFEVNAAGVLVDGVRFDDTEIAFDWDENWEAAVARTTDGWSAEIRIPLGILRFAAAPAQDWGLQVRRHVSARQETAEWAFIPRDEAGEVSRYGRLGPLYDLRRGGRLELRPFVLGKLVDGSGAGAAAGLDAKLHVTPDLTLDATAYPDFGQVEADQVILNLTTTETFLPEKRPFFLEGLDLFSTPIQVLYTRRIGAPAAPPALRDAQVAVAPPEPPPILGALKLAGDLRPGTAIGALAALTGGTTVDLVDGGRARAEPVALFGTLRLRQNLGTRAQVGVIGSSVVRFEDPADYPTLGDGSGRLCPGGEEVAAEERCFHDAWVGGIDGRWRSPTGAWSASGQLLASLIENGPPRTGADGTTVRSGDLAPAASLALAKEGGTWLGELGYQLLGRRFDIDDVGFLSRANVHDFWFSGAHRDTTAGRYLLESRWQVEIYHRRNLDGLDLAEGYQLNHSATTRGFWSWFVELHYRAAHFDDREVGDGTALERAGLLGLETSLGTDPRRAVVANLGSTTQALPHGAVLQLEGSVAFRLLPQLDLELAPELLYQYGEPRIAAAGADGLRFGRLRAESAGITVRGTYTFTPRLTLQAYGQLFLAAGDYSDFSQYAGPVGPGTAIRVADLTPAPPPAENPDFQLGSFNASIVLRWEYTLGSTAYLVYTRAQDAAATLGVGDRPGLDLPAVSRAPGADALLLKLSYWWG